MKLYRTGAFAAVVVGALVLSACSSDKKSDDASSSSSSKTADVACATGTLNGEGSSAQKNAMTEWVNDFQTKCSGATVEYNPSGSGAGVKNFIGGQVKFAGSDSALKPSKNEPADAEKTCGSPAIDLPMVTGPIALAYNLKGVDSLTLTPEVIYNIFFGKITKWNDPAIAAINSGATLPATDIKPFYRSDESGTTDNVENYLAATVPSLFTDKPDKTWSGTAGEGKEKTAGVQQGISSTDGGFGYVEWSYALDANLPVAKVDNGGGAVELTVDSVGKAVSAATVVGTGNDLSLKLDYATKAAGAYPLILVTYEIVCSKYKDAATAALVKAFMTYAANQGQETLTDLGYAPLPSELLTKVKASVATIS